MKCTNKTHHLKIKLLCISCIAALFMNGCGTGKTADIQNPYSLTGDNSSVSSQFFARNLCVTDDINLTQTRCMQIMPKELVFLI